MGLHHDRASEERIPALAKSPAIRQCPPCMPSVDPQIAASLDVLRTDLENSEK